MRAARSTPTARLFATKSAGAPVRCSLFPCTWTSILMRSFLSRGAAAARDPRASDTPLLSDKRAAVPAGRGPAELREQVAVDGQVVGQDALRLLQVSDHGIEQEGVEGGGGIAGGGGLYGQLGHRELT